MTENQKQWLNDLIEEYQIAASNERLWAKGAPDSETARMHAQNAYELAEFAEMLKTGLRKSTEFVHINDVWDFLDNFKTVREMEEAFEEIPSKFGSFSIINEYEVTVDGCMEIENTYWDDHTGEYEYDYHTVNIR